MRILKRLEVKAGLDFNAFLNIKQKHLKDTSEILRKHYSVIFNKFSTPLKYAADSYSILANDFLLNAAGLPEFSTKIPTVFSFESSKYFSLGINIDKDGKAGIELSTPLFYGNRVFLEDFKKQTKDLEMVYSISQKDFDTAYKKSKAEIEKEFKKWEKE